MLLYAIFLVVSFLFFLFLACLTVPPWKLSTEGDVDASRPVGRSVGRAGGGSSVGAPQEGGGYLGYRGVGEPHLWCAQAVELPAAILGFLDHQLHGPGAVVDPVACSRHRPPGVGLSCSGTSPTVPPAFAPRLAGHPQMPAPGTVPGVTGHPRWVAVTVALRSSHHSTVMVVFIGSPRGRVSWSHGSRRPLTGVTRGGQPFSVAWTPCRARLLSEYTAGLGVGEPAIALDHFP